MNSYIYIKHEVFILIKKDNIYITMILIPPGGIGKRFKDNNYKKTKSINK